MNGGVKRKVVLDSGMVLLLLALVLVSDVTYFFATYGTPYGCGPPPWPPHPPNSRLLPPPNPFTNPCVDIVLLGLITAFAVAASGIVRVIGWFERLISKNASEVKS